MGGSLRPAVGAALSALGLLLIIVALIKALMGDETSAMMLLAMSIALTVTSWLVVRRATVGSAQVIRSFTVLTEITCGSCDLREVRAFSKGDYILKHVGKCPRCGGERTITSIFREETEKATSEW